MRSPGSARVAGSSRPRAGGSPDLDDERARELALEAADRLFYERGIRAVRMEQIRDASGVSLKRLYKLFPTKERLAEAALRLRAASFAGDLAAFVEARTTPRERVLAIFDFLDAWVSDPGFRGCAFINAFGELGATSPCVLDAVQAQKRELHETIATLVRDAGGTTAAADQISILFQGATVAAAILGDRRASARARDAADALLVEPR